LPKRFAARFHSPVWNRVCRPRPRCNAQGWASPHPGLVRPFDRAGGRNFRAAGNLLSTNRGRGRESFRLAVQINDYAGAPLRHDPLRAAALWNRRARTFFRLASLQMHDHQTFDKSSYWPVRPGFRSRPHARCEAGARDDRSRRHSNNGNRGPLFVSFTFQVNAMILTLVPSVQN